MRVNFDDARAHRDRCENALSKNTQNGTDHSCLRHSQENISLHFPGVPGSIERGRSAVETFCGLINVPSPPEKFRTYAELLFVSTKFVKNQREILL
ncbi:hypothetical protein TNCV_582271 [Trichonephila clavipes]|nr:hypothetical protein TNCV_582271 [Trichonephila clavipes]